MFLLLNSIESDGLTVFAMRFNRNEIACRVQRLREFVYYAHYYTIVTSSVDDYCNDRIRDLHKMTRSMYV